MAGDNGEQAQIIEGGTAWLRDLHFKGLRIRSPEFLYQSQVEPVRAIRTEACTEPSRSIDLEENTADE